MGDCNNCNIKQEVEKEYAPVPYWVFEETEARHGIREKWYMRIIILLVVLLVGSNVAWMVYESQFETVEDITETNISQENDGGYNNYIGNDGDISYGETNDKN